MAALPPGELAGGVSLEAPAELGAGPIARSETGEHDPPFRGQCPPETRALPHATEMAQPADED